MGPCLVQLMFQLAEVPLASFHLGDGLAFLFELRLRID